MKIPFFQSDKSNWGILQLQLTQTLCDFLGSKKDFEVSFESVRESKSSKQCRGIHKLCSLYAERLSQLNGKKVGLSSAKDSIKYKLGFVELANYDECFKEALKIRREKEILGEKLTLKDFNFLVDKLQKNYYVPRSFASASKEEMIDLIDRFEEFARGMSWHEIKLESEEMKALVECFN